MKNYHNDIFASLEIADAVDFSKEPEVSSDRILSLTKVKIRKETRPMKKQNKKTLIAVIAAAAVLTITAVAAVHFLTPSEVASRLGDTKLADVFSSAESTVLDFSPMESGGYSLDILGAVSGENLSSFAETDADKTYIVGSISRSDGEPLDDYTGLMISPLVSGYAPWTVNIFTLKSSKHAFLSDGVEYFIIETDNLEAFSGHTVYIAVYEGMAPSAEIFAMAEDGSISFAKECDGVKALFTLSEKQ